MALVYVGRFVLLRKGHIILLLSVTLRNYQFPLGSVPVVCNKDQEVDYTD